MFKLVTNDFVKYLDTSSKFYHFVFNSSLFRPLANTVHSLLIRSQIYVLQNKPYAPITPIQEHLESRLTIIIKTFERPKIAKRLIDSIRIQHPMVRILIADDSKTPTHFHGTETIHLPYNSGVGRGRNALLKEVKTPYFLNLDDDFIFYPGTNILTALEDMIKHPEIDIMGGYLINLPFFRKSGPGGNTYTSHRPNPDSKSKIGLFKRYKKVPQFYLGVTKRVALTGWDEDIKCLDHAPFFNRADGILKVVFNENLKILHARTPFNYRYASRRNDTKSDRDIINRRYKEPMLKEVNRISIT